jgi:predicted outer membrane repeat protein
VNWVICIAHCDRNVAEVLSLNQRHSLSIAAAGFLVLLGASIQWGCGRSDSRSSASTPPRSAPPAPRVVAAVCAVPITEDTNPTSTLVGTGTAASCTESALAQAIAKGGVIRFNCGGPATIALTSQKNLRTDVNTTIDGEGQITLDGGGKTRLLRFYSSNFHHSNIRITIQNLSLRNGHSIGTPIATAPSPCSQGFLNDGGGGAIYVRDGILHVLNTIFGNNTGATPGPDVGGGAIYTLGSLETVVVGSSFQSNRASNGGAIGALFGDLSIYNSEFRSNLATGDGANTISSQCAVNGGEVGNGGNGGAVAVDGGENYAMTVCGSTFTSNAAGSGGLGGALFRTPDAAIQSTTIDRSTFTGNSAAKGGALYFHNSKLFLIASTLASNTAVEGGGALFSDSSILNLSNDTFANNLAQLGLGGGIFLSGNGGTLQNVTFLGNQASGGSSYFGAAVAGDTSMTITNTLFSGNTTKDCGSPMTCAAGSSAGNGNLQWPILHAVCNSPDKTCTSNTYFADPKLGPLADNGGPTRTAAPLPGSPAMGIGHSCPATDQRGVARPAAGCTAGAVEGPMSH